MSLFSAIAGLFRRAPYTPPAGMFPSTGPVIIPAKPGPVAPIQGAIPADYKGRAIRLDDADIARAAADLGCEVAAVRAVLAVEAGGSGFLADGRPKILFEAHLFSRETGRRFDASNPRVSSPTWNRLLYAGGAGEYPRLAEAAALDRKAALRSASWGLFQIIGSNHARCGYPTVDAFVVAMCDDEANHLQAFIAFCRAGALDKHLRSHDWAAFARGYNGPSYAANRYDTKLAAAYDRARAAFP